MIRRRRRSSFIVALAGAAAAASLALPATAPAQWVSGDIVIADPNANPNALATDTGAVFKVDPATGQVSVLATGPPLIDPTDVAIDAQGNLLIVDENADPTGLGNFEGAVFRLAPNGAPTLVGTSAQFVNPDGIAVDPGGNIVVADNDADPNALAIDTGAVFRFAPGAPPAPIAADSRFEDPADLAISATGEITVVDDAANPNGFPEPPGTGTIFRFTPGATPAVFATGPPMEGPDGVAIDARGNVLISDDTANPAGQAEPDTGAIFKIGPAGGAIATLATSPQFNDPEHLAIESDGRILVVDDAAEPHLLRVDPATGAVTPFTSSPLFLEPEGVVLVPPKCGGRFATIVGDATNNTLRGTSGADVIWGGRGKDKIKGKRGADRICGDAGKDTLSGQQGKDRLFGGKKGDKLKGGKGRDKLKGGKGPDKLRGGPGNDQLSGGKGKDDVQE